MPTRTALDRSLVEVIDDLLRLSSMTEQAIDSSMKALAERDANLATQVSANDGMLNEIRYTIEEKCYRMIATQAPNSTDLRIVVGAVSVATNLERIGDHAAGIARLTLRMIDQPLLKPLVDLPQMAEIARGMVRDAVKAFSERDVALAEAVVKRDDTIDALHRQVYNDLLGYMTRDTSTVERATFLLWVSHNLERIGDRACNICERAIYVATGELKEIS
ncbi:MAG: phosphate signaling complex protein PhoU [Anaerolineae bacterium]|nr:phosphate signaling complex protein PhoU [Anaerolineae bacterium]